MVSLRLQIDDSFFLPESRNGYLISSEMKAVWAVELDLLNEFARVCSVYHLKWFAHAGTMLGAVRHNGFIPWDDDIDVMMPRKDYEMLCSVCKESFSSPYFFQNDDTDMFFCRNYSRLRNSDTTAIQEWEKESSVPYNKGIFIDIFPYDNIPDDDVLYRSEMRRMESLANSVWYYRDIIYFYHPKKGRGLKKRLSYFIKHLWFKYIDKTKGNYKRILQEHVNLATAHNRERTKRVGEMIVPPLGRHIWNKEWMDGQVYLPFEMLHIPVPSNYEACLRASFGDDWRIPKHQSNYHGLIFFDVDHPYTEYSNNH